MKTSFTIAFACLLAASAWAQLPDRTYEWVRASDEFIQLDAGDYYSGRVYRPGPDGGGMHIIVQAKLPITLAMVASSDWNNARQHPEMMRDLNYRCMREHVTSTTYECQMPPNRPMVLVLYDDRVLGRPILRGVGAIIEKGVVRKLISPNDVQIIYHSWSCVANCVQPEFKWILLAKEKYELTPTPKLYGMTAPENDGQKVWVKIKAPVPMTLAIVPSNIADQIYDRPDTLSSMLSQTACKQRGVQSMEFECPVNMADGPQSVLALPDPPVRSHKKAELEVQTYKCVANCDLLVSNGSTE